MEYDEAKKYLDETLGFEDGNEENKKFYDALAIVNQKNTGSKNDDEELTTEEKKKLKDSIKLKEKKEEEKKSNDEAALKLAEKQKLLSTIASKAIDEYLLETGKSNKEIEALLLFGYTKVGKRLSKHILDMDINDETTEEIKEEYLDYFREASIYLQGQDTEKVIKMAKDELNSKSLRKINAVLKSLKNSKTDTSSSERKYEKGGHTAKKSEKITTTHFFGNGKINF